MLSKDAEGGGSPRGTHATKTTIGMRAVGGMSCVCGANDVHAACQLLLSPMLTVVTVCDGLATARSWKGCASKELFAQGLACEKRSERVGISVFDLPRGPHRVGIYRIPDPRV